MPPRSSVLHFPSSLRLFFWGADVAHEAASSGVGRQENTVDPFGDRTDLIDQLSPLHIKRR